MARKYLDKTEWTWRTRPNRRHFSTASYRCLYAKSGQRNDGIEQDPTSNLVIVDDADDIEFISKRPDIFTKNYSAISMMGISRFNSDGEEWSKRRDITQSSFNSIAHSRNVAPIHDEYAETLIRHAPANATATASHPVRGLIMRIQPRFLAVRDPQVCCCLTSTNFAQDCAGFSTCPGSATARSRLNSRLPRS